MFGRADMRVYRIARNVVGRFTNAEIKSTFKNQASTGISTSGLTVNLFAPTQGLLVKNRVGNSVKLIRHNLNYVLKMHPSATQTNVRVMLLLDKQANEGTISSGGLLEDNNDITSFIENHVRYRITKLYDRMHSMSITGHQGGVFKINKKLNTVVKYDGASGDPTKNSLVILFISDEPTNTPTIQFNSRSRYIDN